MLDSLPYQKLTIILEDDKKIDTYVFDKVRNFEWDVDWTEPEYETIYGKMIQIYPSRLKRMLAKFLPEKDENGLYAIMKRKEKDGNS